MGVACVSIHVHVHLVQYTSLSGNSSETFIAIRAAFPPRYSLQKKDKRQLKWKSEHCLL